MTQGYAEKTVISAQVRQEPVTSVFNSANKTEMSSISLPDVRNQRISAPVVRNQAQCEQDLHPLGTIIRGDNQYLHCVYSCCFYVCFGQQSFMKTVTTVTTVTTYTLPRQAVTVCLSHGLQRPCCERSEPMMSLLANAIRGHPEGVQ